MRMVDGMSCETTTTVMSKRRLISASSASMRRAEIGSRPEKGSSQSRMSGRVTMARASAARLIMPPESWLGSSSSASFEADRVERFAHARGDLRCRRAGCARAAGRRGCRRRSSSRAGRRPGTACRASPARRTCCRSERRVMSSPSTKIRPASGWIEAADQAQRGALAGAAAAEDHRDARRAGSRTTAGRTPAARRTPCWTSSKARCAESAAVGRAVVGSVVTALRIASRSQDTGARAEVERVFDEPSRAPGYRRPGCRKCRAARAAQGRPPVSTARGVFLPGRGAPWRARDCVLRRSRSRARAARGRPLRGRARPRARH